METLCSTLTETYKNPTDLKPNSKSLNPNPKTQRRVAAMLLCRLRPAALGRREVSQQAEVRDAVAEMLLRLGIWGLGRRFRDLGFKA